MGYRVGPLYDVDSAHPVWWPRNREGMIGEIPTSINGAVTKGNLGWHRIRAYIENGMKEDYRWHTLLTLGSRWIDGIEPGWWPSDTKVLSECHAEWRFMGGCEVERQWGSTPNRVYLKIARIKSIVLIYLVTQSGDSANQTCDKGDRNDNRIESGRIGLEVAVLESAGLTGGFHKVSVCGEWEKGMHRASAKGEAR